MFDDHNVFWWEIIFKAEKNQKCASFNNVTRAAVWSEYSCVENDKLRLIDFDDTIDEFAARKARRRMFDNKLPTYRNCILAYHTM